MAIEKKSVMNRFAVICQWNFLIFELYDLVR